MNTVAGLLRNLFISASYLFLLMACAAASDVHSDNAVEAATAGESQTGSNAGAAAATASYAIPGADSEENKAMQAKFGIEVDSLRLTAANYMVNFKFRVLDPDKAVPLMSRKIQPTITLERNGAKFAVPVTEKLGAVRSTPKFAQAGKNYFIFFGNPGGYIKSGERISLEIGEFKLEHLAVQ